METVEMSANNPDEPMEVDVQAETASSQAEPQIKLSLKWFESDERKMKTQLEKTLQSWFNAATFTGGVKVNCAVTEILKDKSAVIKMDPSPDLNELQKLRDVTLMTKDKITGYKIATVLSINLEPPKQDKPPDDVSMTSSVSDKPADKGEFGEQSDGVSTAGHDAADGKTASECPVPLSHFWYMNHIYQEEIQRILKRNKVKIKSEVIVKFEAEQEDGTPAGALSDFTDLVQKCLPESGGSVVPLKCADPDNLRDALRIIQTCDKKLLITVTSEEIKVAGPQKSQDVFSKTLNVEQNVPEPPEEDRSQSPPLKIDMNIDDPLADAGLTMKQDQWKKVSSYHQQITTIQSKFNVDFKESSRDQGDVNIKAVYKRAGGNAAMESHAVRALLRLCQKVLTSPVPLTLPSGAAGFNRSLSEEAFNQNGSPARQNDDAPSGGGATGGDDDEEEKCPICLDLFTNKKRLKCKHEFCEECLRETKKHNGPICPICKDVFGVMEGDQPDGTMTSYRSSLSLPGFPRCGHISITYDIPSGTQTREHPKPGDHYSGIHREAYLPDNEEGNEVLRLLRKAFEQKLIFTVGTSRTTGLDNRVTWNDIHHKTSMSGGPSSFGYPDPDYLSRVKEELKAKGIK